MERTNPWPEEAPLIWLHLGTGGKFIKLMNEKVNEGTSPMSTK